jgi:site-specific DNA-adenine methylase
MTAYHGGKQRLGKRIAKAITDNVDLSKVKGYCEPFCGMLGVYRHVPTHFSEYKAGDLNLSVIKMWEAAQCHQDVGSSSKGVGSAYAG